MTLSRSNTPLGEPAQKARDESVLELDNLLEDLKKAQVTDSSSVSKSHQYYSSTSSLNKAGTTGRSYSRSPTSSSTGGGGASHHHQNTMNSSHNPTSSSSSAALQRELDTYTQKLESEMNRNPDSIPRGVFVKDVVEEEILVDHVLIQPKSTQQQQSDKKFITKQSERVKGERAKRQVAFMEHNLQPEDDSETYDNTDTEQDQHHHHHHQVHRQHQHSHSMLSKRDDGQSASMQSLNSATTDQSDMTETSSILDPNKIINCYSCGERVVGKVITALGRNYHKEHFTCAHCNQELGTRNFYEKDNLPYCEKDYQSLFSPKCAACGEPILDKVTIALERTFHPEHFVCAYCGCQFDSDDGFHEKDGKPYCKNDFFELFATKCAGCMLPITANYITALNVQWHPDCFVCSDCHCPFADGKFFDIDGAPYCEIHYHARKGSLCAVCRQPIIGKCTTAMFRKFHPDHFTCTYCLKVLTRTFKEENDKPYCHDCFDKLYS